MSMYGYDVSFYDYGFSDPAITSSLYGNSVSPMAAAIDYDDGVYVRRRPPPRPTKTPSSPSKHRHDGTSPLPLGMDWSLPPRIWEGRNSVWPHDSRKGWSYCVTVPSWTIIPSDSGSDTVFFRVQVGILSPEGITTTRGVLRRFNEFLKLYSELRKEFPKKILPPAPPRRLMKMRSTTLLEERRCGLEGWVEKLLSDIDVSRTLLVAIFLELEAAARQSCCELNEEEESAAANLVQFPSNSGISSDLSAPRPEKENYAEPDIDNAASERENFRDNSSVNISDMEELQRKCMELELKLTIEQDARAYAESMKASAIQQNEVLLKELDDAREQVEIMRKQQDEVELKSKSDVKILVKEVKSLRTSHSELKQELSKCLEEKVELEKEKQRWETENAIKMAVLHECQLLHNRLRDSSVNFLADEENKLIVDTSLSDAINLLETSDNQISLLLAEAQLLIAEDAKTATGAADENRDDELRRLMGDILADNAKLRKQVTQLAINTLQG